MNSVECEFEPEVLAAVLQSRWPDHVDDRLRAHVSHCAICSDVTAIAGTFDTLRSTTRAAAVIPDSGRVWWLAQVRARREALESASRPITIAQAIAIACAVGVLGACFGATSAWFQAAFQWTAANLARIDLKHALVATTGFATQHAAVIVGLAAVLLVVPAAFLIAVGREKPPASS